MARLRRLRILNKLPNLLLRLLRWRKRQDKPKKLWLPRWPNSIHKRRQSSLHQVRMRWMRSRRRLVKCEHRMAAQEVLEAVCVASGATTEVDQVDQVDQAERWKSQSRTMISNLQMPNSTRKI